MAAGINKLTGIDKLKVSRKLNGTNEYFSKVI
jgi:hypothetical protein